MNIYVGNLSYTTSEDALTSAFQAHGNVESVRIITDRNTGRSKGFAFVDMNDNTEAQNAITALNDSTLDGRKLNVREATPRAVGNNRPNHRSGGGSFR